jgi:hypothetical protein
VIASPDLRNSPTSGVSTVTTATRRAATGRTRRRTVGRRHPAVGRAENAVSASRNHGVGCSRGFDTRLSAALNRRERWIVSALPRNDGRVSCGQLIRHPGSRSGTSRAQSRRLSSEGRERVEIPGSSPDFDTSPTAPTQSAAQARRNEKYLCPK